MVRPPETDVNFVPAGTPVFEVPGQPDWDGGLVGDDVGDFVGVGVGAFEGVGVGDQVGFVVGGTDLVTVGFGVVGRAVGDVGGLVTCDFGTNRMSTK
jgi:hypothetical protein